MRRKCIARIHQVGGRPSVEGVLVRRSPSYVLEQPRVIEDEDRTVEVEGRVEVLREHVAFVQLLAKAA